MTVRTTPGQPPPRFCFWCLFVRPAYPKMVAEMVVAKARHLHSCAVALGWPPWTLLVQQCEQMWAARNMEGIGVTHQSPLKIELRNLGSRWTMETPFEISRCHLSWDSGYIPMIPYISMISFGWGPGTIAKLVNITWRTRLCRNHNYSDECGLQFINQQTSLGGHLVSLLLTFS